MEGAKSTTCNLFFTITLKPKYYCLTWQQQLDLTADELRQILNKFSFEGICVMEFTKQYNIHYHGFGTFTVPSRIKHPLITFSNVIKGKDSKFGRFEVEQAINSEKTLLYVTKEIEMMFREHKVLPIINRKNMKNDIWNRLNDDAQVDNLFYHSVLPNGSV